ncbi:MAG: molybdenum cofactor guanylyltransferase [Geodermatophilaceae bacterium]|nr:molybdenum cofactor guanylyltransferase [Geodermatophilaceae bacterium]
MTGGYDAIVLAGGRSSRLSGQHKPQLQVGDATMVEWVLSAVQQAGARIVVGPPQPLPDGVLLVQEQPAGSGPVAGLAAGVVLTSAEVVMVVAADLPFLTAEVVEALVAALGDEADVALLVDENGRDQYLLGAWRAASLRRALDKLGPLPGRAMSEVVRALRVARVELTSPTEAPPPWTDVDTPADLARARREWS